MQAYMEYSDDTHGTGATFRWHGGEYIEIGSTIMSGDEIGEWCALDVINVWDHAEDRPRIPRTLEAFQTRCDEWVADHAEELA